MLLFCSTGRACLGIFLVEIISGQKTWISGMQQQYGSSSGTGCWVLKYTAMVPGYRDRMNKCIYVLFCIVVVVVVHVHLRGGWVWCRLSAIAPFKLLDIDHRSTQYRQCWENCVGCRYIAVLFPAGNYAGTINRGITANVFHIAQHATAQHKAIIPTPNPSTAQLAGGKRWHDGCQPGTICGHREFCSDTLVARLSSLSCLYVLLQDCFAFLDNMYRNTVRTAMHDVRPPAKADIYFELWRWIWLEGKPGYVAVILFFAHGDTHRRRQIARDREARTYVFF